MHQSANNDCHQMTCLLVSTDYQLILAHHTYVTIELMV